jgi:hypothetical protein
MYFEARPVAYNPNLKFVFRKVPLKFFYRFEAHAGIRTTKCLRIFIKL